MNSFVLIIIIHVLTCLNGFDSVDFLVVLSVYFFSNNTTNGNLFLVQLSNKLKATWLLGKAIRSLHLIIQ